MRKSNNYFKFLEYVTYGKDHDNTIDKGNGVLECKSYVSISDIEYRYNTTFGLENDWLTFKNILINEDTLYVYYIEGENSKLVGVYLLDNFKTQKELKETITIACTEFAHCILLEKSEVREEAKIENINHCPNRNTCCIVSPFVPCNYNYKSDSCIKAHKNFIHNCEQVHKQMKAKHNPEWHHVSLATLANIDFDMLDEKRKVYLSFYKKWQEVRKNLRKCSCGYNYDRCRNVFRRSLTIALGKKKISKALVVYFERQLSMVNVECGVWSSAVEVATGEHESRKYNKTNLRY